MTEQYQAVADLLGRVGSRGGRLVAFRAVLRVALAAAGSIAVALILSHWLARAPMALAVLGCVCLVALIGCVLWGLWPLRDVPSSARLARFIEERKPGLDEGL